MRITLKELFKMVEQTNKLNELIGNEKTSIEFSEEISSVKDNTFYTYKEFKKSIKKVYIDEVANQILDNEYTQCEHYKNTFTTIGCFKDKSTEYTIII